MTEDSSFSFERLLLLFEFSRSLGTGSLMTGVGLDDVGVNSLAFGFRGVKDFALGFKTFGG